MIDPILITGCPRSGTSLVAAILSASGAQGGFVRPNHNQHSDFDHPIIQTNIVAPLVTLLSVREAEGTAFHALPPRDLMLKHLNAADTLRRQAVTVMLSQRVDTHKPWFIKDTRFVGMWPIVASAFPRAKWIIVRRKDEDIISSCMQTGSMKLGSSEAEWKQIVGYYKTEMAALLEMRSYSAREVWPEKFLQGSFDEIREAVSFASCDYDHAKTVDLISPRLWYRGISGVAGTAREAPPIKRKRGRPRKVERVG